MNKLESLPDAFSEYQPAVNRSKGSELFGH
ncbi:IS1 encoded protein [Escherichia coli]|nr:IS1 encoded protein [Escherichia coli]EFF1809096.1 IS1 encoded protein [Escherichia coli]